MTKSPLSIKPGSGVCSAMLVLAGLVQASWAGTIQGTFDPTTFGATSNAASAESAIQTAINAINSLYSNSGSVPVLFMYNSSLGGGADTSSAEEGFAYSTYRSDLVADSTAHPSNTVLSTAVASLPSSASQTVVVTVPFANLVLGQGLPLCFNASGTFVSGCGQQYAAVVTVSAPSTVGSYYTGSTGHNSQAVSAAEHELDEVLGGGGAGTTLTDTSTGTPTTMGPTDFYRFGSTGTGCTAATGLTTTRSWTDSSSTVSCYSINGGVSAITDALGNPIQFNQSGGGSDYGDFAQPGSGANIQDAYESSTLAPVYTSSSPEATMMESIGYNLTSSSTPEPATWTMFLAAGVGGVLLRNRRT